MQRRRVLGFNQPINPLMGGKAGSKDPRDFISGNEPGQQWDEQQFARDRADAYGHPPPQISDVVRQQNQAGAEVIVRTIPTRTTFVQWNAYFNDELTPHLIVPRNPRRISIQFGNGNFVPFPIPPGPQTLSGDILFSWGAPLVLDSSGTLRGTVLSVGNVISLVGDCVPIDELWMWAPFQIGSTFFHTYSAYEGIEAPEGN